MIDLFNPPVIIHKNAVKVKGYASIGERDEYDFNRWLGKQARKEEKQKERKTLAEKIKIDRIADLRKAMIEADKAYEIALKKYQEMGLEVRRLRAAKDNRTRSYRRASL